MSYQFQNLSTKQESPVRENFMEAWNDMYQYVKARIEDGGISTQELETCIWINHSFVGKTIPINFYNARDNAIENHNWKPS